MKKILVTGGAGFIGSHLCEKLVLQGHEVVCVDNFYTSTKENISHLLNQSNFSLIEHDVCHPFDFAVDQIYHLACPASPKHYQRDPIFTMRTSVLGAINVLEIARKYDAFVLQASTSEVYGDPLVHPQNETYLGNVNPIGIRACYDEGKRCAETLFFDYFRKFNVKVHVARIFNTYGPKMQEDDGRVISNFITQAIQGKALTMYGKGNQTRSFCYIDDLVEGLILLMNSSQTGPINLGNPTEVTIAQLAELILLKTQSTSALAYLPLPADDPKVRCPDVTLAKEKLNWEPKITLEQGVENMLAYFLARSLI